MISNKTRSPVADIVNKPRTYTLDPTLPFLISFSLKNSLIILPGSPSSKHSPKAPTPASIPSLSETSSHREIKAFCLRTASIPFPPISLTHSSTAPSNSESSTTLPTRPQLKASSAEIVDPRSKSCLVRPQPINPGRRAASTTDGIPRRTCSVSNTHPTSRAKPNARTQQTRTEKQRNEMK